jgi:hypothetical protein
LSNVVAIAAGHLHSLALTDEGQVVGWGHNWYGETTMPTGLGNVVAIAAGEHGSLALQADGRPVAWGVGYAMDMPIGLSNVVAVAAGGSHSLALVRPPQPRLTVKRQESDIVLTWSDGQAPYQVQQCRQLGVSNAWENVGEPVRTNSLSLPMGRDNLFLRVRGP